ncbi:MAG: CotH kinase family protein [Acholeplasmataceae bacterium]
MKKISLFGLLCLMVLVLFACDIPLTQGPIDVTPTIDEQYHISSFERFFDDSKEKSLTIHVTRSQWDLLDTYMIDYYERFGSYRDDRYVLSSVTYSDQEGEIELPDVAFRTRGNLSRVRIQDDEGGLYLSHFKLKFNRVITTNPFEENPEIEKRLVFGLEEIDLKYNRNLDETMISEKYAHDLMRDFGVYAQHTTLVKLYLNIDGEETFYGLYTAFEPIDEHFINRRFDNESADGNLYKSLWQQFGPATLSDNYEPNAIGIRNVQENYRPTYDLKTNKRTNQTTDLQTFIANINQLNGVAFQTYIEAHFDVDRFLRLMAVGALLGNPDDYRAMGNNYYLYHDPVEMKFHMIPYDYDHGLGQGWNGFGDQGLGDYSLGLDLITWVQLTDAFTGSDQSHVLSEKILAFPAYVITYQNYLLELIDETDGLFRIENFIALYTQQKTLYEDDLPSDLQSLTFGLRNIEWYYQEKTTQVVTQLG